MEVDALGVALAGWMVNFIGVLTGCSMGSSSSSSESAASPLGDSAEGLGSTRLFKGLGSTRLFKETSLGLVSDDDCVFSISFAIGEDLADLGNVGKACAAGARSDAHMQRQVTSEPGLELLLVPQSCDQSAVSVPMSCMESASCKRMENASTRTGTLQSSDTWVGSRVRQLRYAHAQRVSGVVR